MSHTVELLSRQRELAGRALAWKVGQLEAAEPYYGRNVHTMRRMARLLDALADLADGRHLSMPSKFATFTINGALIDYTKVPSSPPDTTEVLCAVVDIINEAERTWRS